MTSPLLLKGAAGALAVRTHGNERGPTVLFSHSILTSGAMWNEQARLLANKGWHVVCMDTRGHGASAAPPAPYSMQDLVADTIAVLDALEVETVHFVGLSLGGMIGFGLALDHPHRLASMCVCDARADAPPAFRAPWDERIDQAARGGCAALADATLQRWFGAGFADAQPEVARAIREQIAATSTEGFIGCARALQNLDYLPRVHEIDTRTTLVVGQNDGPLPQAMEDIRERIGGSLLEVIPHAGHLPNIDQPHAFNDALLRHLARATHGDF